MFAVARPSRATIERFIRASQKLPLSYAPPGLLQTGISRGHTDEMVAAIGRGEADFARACAALTAWTHFDIGWVEVFPADAPIDPGTIVAVLIRHLGFWSLNGARVVYTTGDGESGSRFGFAYGTLTNHAEAGEELFEVILDPDSGEVFYRIDAVSWPRAPLARLGYPVVRALQARFRRDSAEAMRRAISGAASRGR